MFIQQKYRTFKCNENSILGSTDSEKVVLESICVNINACSEHLSACLMCVNVYVSLEFTLNMNFVD